MVFNNEYNQMKNTHSKFKDDAGIKLLCESLRRWGISNPVIKHKIINRLKTPIDDMDLKVYIYIYIFRYLRFSIMKEGTKKLDWKLLHKSLNMSKVQENFH